MGILHPNRPEEKAGGPPGLLPRHLADLRSSGLSDEQIVACGFFSESGPDRVGRLLNWRGAATVLGPCLCFPFRDRDGVTTVQVMVKPDTPRMVRGKPVKYESPLKEPLRVYTPPGTRAALADPTMPLLITEGMKKAAKADQEGFACVGLVGVYGWQKKRPTGADGKKGGPRELIPDLDGVEWAGRRVTLAFDSDVVQKPDVALAEWFLAEALMGLGALVQVVRLPPGEGGRKVGLDDFLLDRGPDALRLLIETARTPSRPPKTNAVNERPPAAADVLVGIGQSFELWHDESGTGFATVGRYSHPVRSKSFRHALVSEYRKRTGKAPAGEALATALTTIEAAAVYDGPEHPVHVRVAGCGGRLYLSLADRDGTVIEVDADGWRVCERSPVRFRKAPGMQALPLPKPGGDLARLRNYLNVPDDDAFALVVAWLAWSVRPDGPFPVFVLAGEQGSANTTTARVLKKLIDPSTALVRATPRTDQDLMIQARNGWVLAFDNLSGLPTWLSDALCRLATGGGLSTRELYTNDEEVIFDAERPMIANGIEDFATRGDLLERAVLLRHPTIPEERRVPESEFWAGFDDDHPLLLGALLTYVAGGLREREHVRLASHPRMADFAAFAVACERGAGTEPPRFLAAYAENQATAHEQALEASPLPAALLAFMSGRDAWEGPARELLGLLGPHAPDLRSPDWPKRPNVLTNKLRRMAVELRKVHRLAVECDGRRSGAKSAGRRTRVVHIERLPDPTPAGSSPPTGGRPGGSDVRPPDPGDGPGRPARTPSPPTVPPDRPHSGACWRAGAPAGDGGDDGDGPPATTPAAPRVLFGSPDYWDQMLPD